MMDKNTRLDEVLGILKEDETFSLFSAKALDLNSTYLSNITSNSKQVAKGGLFIALKGQACNGEDYISEAIERGASTILARSEVCQELFSSFPGVRFLGVEEPRRYVGKLAGLFYPALPPKLVAVTGTNGKTSVVEFVRQFWGVLGEKSASIGTLGVRQEGEMGQAGLTTMDPIDLRKTLNQLAKNKVTHIALEASSHGLDQHRLGGLFFQAAGFTNLTQDHLDYHKTFKHYFQSKALLFSEHLAQDGIAVLNADTSEFNQLEIACGVHQIFSFGKSGQHFNLKYIESVEAGQKVSADIFDVHYQFVVPLVGRFQVMNVLCAMGIVSATYPQVERHRIIETLIQNMDKLQPVPGRMEKVGSLNQAGIYVDFAHTPDALQVALVALRQHAQGRVCVVFGCGGNRDTKKRSLMGEVAEQYADMIVVTDDNPRFEQPGLIRQAILDACPKGREIGGRREAISWAIEQLQPGDVLLIAGKGHEEGQTVEGQVFPFNDRLVVQEILEKEK